jgi:hypothetical protein
MLDSCTPLLASSSSSVDCTMSDEASANDPLALLGHNTLSSLRIHSPPIQAKEWRHDMNNEEVDSVQIEIEKWGQV